MLRRPYTLHFDEPHLGEKLADLVEVDHGVGDNDDDSAGQDEHEAVADGVVKLDPRRGTCEARR